MHGFLGAVNYYRDMWNKQANILSPLSNKSGKKKFHWTDEMDITFLWMKAILSAETLMPIQIITNPFTHIQMHLATRW